MPAPAAPPTSATWLFQELTGAHLLAPDRAAAALAQFRAGGAADRQDAASLAEFLVQAGLLSGYQAGRALAGEAQKLLLGPYLLVEPVGAGSLGTVFRATHRTTRQRVAVKVLPLRSLWNVLQAKKQVQLFAGLAPHPAVVPFVDIDTAAGSHYLAWPFVEGASVESIVERSGPLAPASAARFLADVADGLAVCHAKGIVHGLVKPSNLLLGPDHRAKILDLGVGAILQQNVAEDESLFDTISTANTAMRMVDCAAPETLAEPTTRTAAGDLYSLGCVLYYALTGHYPFPDGNIVDRIIAHQTREPVPVRRRAPAVGEELAGVLSALLRKSPSERPTAARARDLLLAATPAEVVIETPPVPLAAAAPWRAAAPDEGSINFDQPSPLPARRGRAQGWVVDSAALDLYEIEEAAAETPSAGGRTVPDSPAGSRLPPPRAVNWSGGSVGSSSTGGRAHVVPPVAPRRSAWRQLLRRIFPWGRPRDTVQLSLFGPPELVPGQTYRFQVYAHPPEAFASVRTLSRAFQPDTGLRGAGFAGRPVARASEIGLHLALSGAGVAKPLVRFKWVGQTRPWAFEVYLPWETPVGVAAGVLTVGLDDQQTAEIAFEVSVLPRGG